MGARTAFRASIVLEVLTWLVEAMLKTKLSKDVH